MAMGGEGRGSCTSPPLIQTIFQSPNQHMAWLREYCPPKQRKSFEKCMQIKKLFQKIKKLNHKSFQFFEDEHNINEEKHAQNQ